MCFCLPVEKNTLKNPHASFRKNQNSLGEIDFCLFRRPASQSTIEGKEKQTQDFQATNQMDNEARGSHQDLEDRYGEFIRVSNIVLHFGLLIFCYIVFASECQHEEVSLAEIEARARHQDLLERDSGYIV